MSLQGRRLLLVEDEVKLAEVLAEYLRADGADVHLMHGGDGVLEWIRIHAPDLLLLDLMLPGVDGLSLCRGLRRFSQTPVIMLTARIDEIDRLSGLELGADDYICKPFSPREVVARVRAVLRRTQGAAMPADPGTVWLRLDTERFEAFWDGQALPLTPVEFRLLSALAARPGRVLSRDQLAAQLYLDHRVVSDRTIDSHVRNLRRKLQAVDPRHDPLQSVYAVGYKLQLPES